MLLTPREIHLHRLGKNIDLERPIRRYVLELRALSDPLTEDLVIARTRFDGLTPLMLAITSAAITAISVISSQRLAATNRVSMRVSTDVSYLISQMVDCGKSL